MADIHIKNFRLKSAGRYYHVWYTSQNEERYIGTCKEATLDSILGNKDNDYSRVLEKWSLKMEQPKPMGGYHGGAPPRKENKKQIVSFRLEPDIIEYLNGKKNKSIYIAELIREDMKREEEESH